MGVGGERHVPAAVPPGKTPGSQIATHIQYWIPGRWHVSIWFLVFGSTWCY